MFTLWEEIIKIIIFCTLNRIKILPVLDIKFDCFVLLSVNSAVLSNQVIQSIFLTQACFSEVLRNCKEQQTSSLSHTHTQCSLEDCNANKNKVLEKSFLALKKSKYIRSQTSCLFPSTVISMNMRQKLNRGKLIQQGLKGHTQSLCCG